MINIQLEHIRNENANDNPSNYDINYLQIHVHSIYNQTVV